MTYQEYKKELQAKYDELFKQVDLFWAFGNEQFAEGSAKHPLEEGFTYCSIGAGGYFPGQHKQAWNDGMTAIKAWEKQAKKDMKETREQTERAILYELNNHEAFYSGDYDDVIDLFQGVYTAKQVRDVYKKYQSTNGEYKKAFDAANGR